MQRRKWIPNNKSDCTVEKHSLSFTCFQSRELTRWRKMSNRGRRTDLEERRKRRKRAEMIEKIPVLTVSGASRNRNLIRSRRRSVISPLRCFLICRLKQDLEERARSSGPDSGQELRVETLYVDTTRNVGVVLGTDFILQGRLILTFSLRREWPGQGYKETGNREEGEGFPPPVWPLKCLLSRWRAVGRV